MPLRIKPTRRATKQIRDETRWWRRNRTRAPGLFREELRRAFQLITEYPEAGAIDEDVESGDGDVRRLLLAGTQHYLYYSLNEAAGYIEILGVWSTNRGDKPTW